MKEFPRFTESIIQLELKQPHCKIIFVALQALINQLEAGLLPDQFESILVSTKKRMGVKLAAELTQDQTIFLDQVHLVADAFTDAFNDKQMFYVNAFLKDINDHFDQHYDREVFDLADGQTLKIEDMHSVYG